MFVRLGMYTSREIHEDPSAFVRLDDGTLAHRARVVSDPKTSCVAATDQVHFTGEVEAGVAAACERDEAFVLFVERAPDSFVFVGRARCVHYRVFRGVVREVGLHTDAPLPNELLAAVAPGVLSAAPPEPASIDVWIELTRAERTWTARCVGLDIASRADDLRDALSAVEPAAAAAVLARKRRGESCESPRPETAGLRAVVAGHDWPWDEVQLAARVVVRVNVFSADLAIPGWAMSRDACWY